MLYHLSYKNLGDEVFLLPSISEDRSRSETSKERVCASPSIDECIVAIHKCEQFKKMKDDCMLCLFVYEIEDERLFSPYSDVFDFDKTQEHVAFEPAKANLKHIIHVPRANNAQYVKNKIPVPAAHCVYEYIDIDIYNRYYNSKMQAI